MSDERKFPSEADLIHRMTAGKGYIEIPVDSYVRQPTTPNPMVMEKRPRRPRPAPSYEAISILILAFAVTMLALVLAVKL